MSQRIPFVGGLALSAVCAGLQGQGGEEDRGILELEALLNTPVISATRTSHRADVVPATVLVITRNQIQRRKYRSLVEVFKDLPDFKVDIASDYDSYNAITVRGIRGQQKLVILMDGVRITGPTNEPVPLLENFPVHFARQIEVLYGPASALYGADAFVGVVNIITRSPEEGARSEVVAGLGTDGQYLGQFYLNQPLGKGVLSLGGQGFSDRQPDLFSRYPQDFAGVASYRSGVFNTPFGFTQTPQTPFNLEFQNPISASALWARYHQDRVTFSFFHRYGKHTSNTANNPAYAIYNNDVFLGTELTTLHATLEELSGSLGYSSSLTANRYTLNPRSSYRNFFTGQEIGWEYAQSSTARFDQQFTLRPGVWELVLGFSAESQNATVKTPDLQNPINEGGPIQGNLLGTSLPADVYVLKGTGLGVFMQGMVDLDPTFSLALGARYDHDSRYGSTFNPRLGLVWTPTSKATFKLLAGSAFLAPSPQDTFNHYGSFTPDGSGGYTSPFWHLPNPGLKPQKLDTLELSGRFGLASSLHLSLTAFHTKVRDLFAQAPDAGNTNLYGGTFKGYPVSFIEVFINQGEQINRGGTLRLDYAGAFLGQGRAQAYLALSHVDGSVDVKGDGRKVELPNIAPWTLRLGGDFTWGAFNASPRLIVLNRQRILDVEPGRPDSRKTLSGYTLLDLTLSYRFASLEVFLRADNALDATYRNVSPQSNINAIEFVGTPQNPRRLMGGLVWRF